MDALFTRPLLLVRYLSAARAEMAGAEIARVEALAEASRARVHDLSRFMRTSNEHVARLANPKNGLMVRSREGCFESQTLLDDYLKLVDWTGWALRCDKRGHIAAHQPRILGRLGIDGERFIASAARLRTEPALSIVHRRLAVAPSGSYTTPEIKVKSPIL